MALVASRAIVLRNYRLGETSKVVVCYTRDHGKVRLVAKGVRKGGGRLGGALEPMTVSSVTFYLKSGRDLSLVSRADIERRWATLRADVIRMAYAGAMLELVDALVPDLEPDPDLFDLFEGALCAADSAPEAELNAVLWRFELSLARASGYSPELTRCVVCGRAEPGRLLSARSGGLVCEECEGRAPGGFRVSARAASALASLASGIEETASLSEGLSQTARDEVGDALLRFLGEHSGTELRLRSMRFLSQIRRTEAASEKDEPEDVGTEEPRGKQ